MKRHLLPLVLFALFIGCESRTHTAAPPTGEKITLKLNLPKGTKNNLVISADIDMKVKEGSNSGKVAMGMLFGMDIESLEVDSEGNHLLKMGFNRLKMSINAGPQSIDYDSDVKGSNPMVERELGPMLEETFTMKMNPFGEVLEVGGLDDASPEFRDQIEQTENQMGMVASFPKTPIDNGDSWTQTIEQNQNDMKMTTEATYTLLDQKDGKAIIGVSGDVKGDLAGTVFGKFNVDIDTGWIIDGEIELKAKGSMNPSSSADMTMLMNFKNN